MSDKENASKEKMPAGGKKGRNHKPFGEIRNNGSFNERWGFTN